VNGATFLGLALACGDPDNTLIIEKGSVLGSDYYSSLRVDSLEGFEIIEEYSKELFEMIRIHKHMINDNVIVISEIMPVLGKFVEKYHLNIMLDSTIINQSETEKGYITETICRDQIMMLESEYYIDTTNHYHQTSQLSCNVLVKSNGEKITIPNGTSYHLSKDIYCLEIPVKTANMQENRATILSLFKKPMESRDVLLMIAETVCLRGEYKEVREGNRIIACSSQTRNLFDAMDKGIALWRNL